VILLYGDSLASLIAKIANGITCKNVLTLLALKPRVARVASTVLVPYQRSSAFAWSVTRSSSCRSLMEVRAESFHDSRRNVLAELTYAAIKVAWSTPLELDGSFSFSPVPHQALSRLGIGIHLLGLGLGPGFIPRPESLLSFGVPGFGFFPAIMYLPCILADAAEWRALALRSYAPGAPLTGASTSAYQDTHTPSGLETWARGSTRHLTRASQAPRPLNDTDRPTPPPIRPTLIGPIENRCSG
jgi:hypothetical protein